MPSMTIPGSDTGRGDVAQGSSRFRIMRAVGDWPLVVRIVALCAAIAILLTVVLTAAAYLQVRDGLAAQARASLGAEGQLLASAIDDWNARRLGSVEIATAMPATIRVLEAGADARPEDVQVVNEM